MNRFEPASAGGDSLFHELLESAPDAMVIVNKTGAIVLVNSQAERLFGYSRAELLGQPLEILLPPRFRQIHAAQRDGYFAEPTVREMGSGLDLYAVRKNGEEFPVAISLSPLRTEREMLAISSIRDVSDRKRLERALQERTVELDRLERERGSRYPDTVAVTGRRVSALDKGATLLVIDSEAEVLATVDRVAQGFGFSVVSRTDARAALADLPVLKPDAVLVALEMPHISGLDVLRAVCDINPVCRVILMTDHASVDTAIEAVKLGALDCINKPFDLDRLGGLLTGIRKGIERRARLMEVDVDVAKTFAFQGMIGRGPAMQELFDSVRRFAPHVRTVLVTGETGTGKELVARALHTLGDRSDRRLVTVNCSAVVETLFESELFGHQRGAFTGATDTKIGLFEHADKGTLFLDEIGELPLAIQAKLLRAVDQGEVQRVGSLEGKHVDVAVIAATNRNLRDEAVNGRFRSDLYYRLSVIEIHIVPLRERREDVPYLSAVFLREAADRLNRPMTGMTAAAERILIQAQWPGNVRELRNVIERACLLSDGKILSARDVLTAMPPASATQPPLEPTESTQPLRGSALGPNMVTNARRVQIEDALRAAHGNKVVAARLLGISRRSMYRWLERLHLQ